jgi:hypothetical protein
MTLIERTEDIYSRYGIRLSCSTLARYYRRHEISFTKADIHFINKTLNARRIQME